MQKGRRTGSGRKVRLEKSLQLGGSAYGIRTRVAAVRGRRPRPLDECATLVVPLDDLAAAAAN